MRTVHFHPFLTAHTFLGRSLSSFLNYPCNFEDRPLSPLFDRPRILRPSTFTFFKLLTQFWGPSTFIPFWPLTHFWGLSSFIFCGPSTFVFWTVHFMSLWTVHFHPVGPSTSPQDRPLSPRPQFVGSWISAPYLKLLINLAVCEFSWEKWSVRTNYGPKKSVRKWSGPTLLFLFRKNYLRHFQSKRILEKNLGPDQITSSDQIGPEK